MQKFNPKWIKFNLSISDTYLNPAETGFYYLSSRFYDPEIGRFINVDGQISGVAGNIIGYNMYSYCMNNPVNMSDENGEWPLLAILKTVAVAVVVAKAVNTIINRRNKKKLEKKLQPSYTREQAKNAIDNIGNNASNGVATTIRDSGVTVTNSCKVRSRYERQEASMIIERTYNEDGSKLTERSSGDLAAEWLWHNIGYYVSENFMSNEWFANANGRSQHASLDRERDSEIEVWLPTAILYMGGFE